MEALLLWPERPLLSLFVLWLVSLAVLWAARRPMLELLAGLGRHLDEGLSALSRGCRTAARKLAERNRAALLTAGEVELRSKLARELQRIDQGFSERLGQYSGLQRRLDDLTQKLDADYKQTGEVPPEVPGWTSAVESVSALPANGDPNVQKILESIRKSIQESEKKALRAHRDDSNRRHKILSGMLPTLRDVKSLLARTRDCVDRALETTTRVNDHVERYGGIREGSAETARTLSHSAVKLFAVSLLVLGVALGGAFINFQLIARPMAEAVGANSVIGNFKVAEIAALVIILLETAMGLFLMESFRITRLFPMIGNLPDKTRQRMIYATLSILFFFAFVEAGLAYMREILLEDELATTAALRGGAQATAASSYMWITTTAQMVMGFVLPFALTFVAIPLESFVESARTVMGMSVAALLRLMAAFFRVLSKAADATGKLLVDVYDIAIFGPLWLESIFTFSKGSGNKAPKAPKPAKAEKPAKASRMPFMGGSSSGETPAVETPAANP